MSEKLENKDFTTESINSNLERLSRQLWKVIPMRENQEDWKKQLSTVLLELRGMSKIFDGVQEFLILNIKLEGAKTEKNFRIYRKAIFDSLELIGALKKKNG